MPSIPYCKTINITTQTFNLLKKLMKMLANTLEHISMGKEEGSSRKVFHIISAQIKSWD